MITDQHSRGLSKPTKQALTLTLNVPVPYKYGTHQCVEPWFHALEPHLSRISRALPTRVPRTRAVVRRRPRNSHSHASRGSAHFHAFAGRSSAHFHAIGSRSSAHFHAIRSRRSANFDGSTSHAFPRNDKLGPVHSHEITNNRFQCCHGELKALTLGVPRYFVIHRPI